MDGDLWHQRHRGALRQAIYPPPAFGVFVPRGMSLSLPYPEGSAAVWRDIDQPDMAVTP